MPDITKTLEELDRLHAEATPGPWKAIDRFGIQGADLTKVHDDRPRSADLIVALHNAYPALRSHIAEMEAKAAGFDLIRDLFHRFDTRFAGARDQVLLTDDLLERTREAIESAVKKETK